VKTLSRIGIATVLVAGLALSGCANTRSIARSLSPFGSGQNEQPAGIGVNSFLWRASLETLNFMPLDSVDPYGGVIITDWHSDSATPNERFKVTVYILDTRLRADGLKASVFKQILDDADNWKTANIDPDTEIQIENSILTRARELRIRNLRKMTTPRASFHTNKLKPDGKKPGTNKIAFCPSHRAGAKKNPMC